MSIAQLTVTEILRFCDFQDGRRLSSWIFKCLQFLWPVEWKGSKCVIVPNYVAIDQSVAETWLFSDFFGDGLENGSPYAIGPLSCPVSLFVTLM